MLGRGVCRGMLGGSRHSNLPFQSLMKGYSTEGPDFKLPTDMRSAIIANHKLGMGFMRRGMAWWQVAMIKKEVDPSFDTEDFIQGAQVAYRAALDRAVGRGRNLKELEGMVGPELYESMAQLVQQGTWVGWEDLEGGHIEVHDVYCEIAQAKLAAPPEGGSDISKMTTAMFDVRYLTYESLIPSEGEGESNGPEMKASTWRFQGELVDDENLPNPALQFKIIGIEGV